MNFLQYIIRSLFLVKEIISKEGVIHFRRYRLLSLPWFNIYIHQIMRSDLDTEMHDHPFHFTSIILSGAYHEDSIYPSDWTNIIGRNCYQGDVIEHRAEDAHKLTLLTKEVWTLVITSGRNRVWGYRFQDGNWIDFQTYRTNKNGEI